MEELRRIQGINSTISGIFCCKHVCSDTLNSASWFEHFCRTLPWIVPAHHICVVQQLLTVQKNALFPVISCCTHLYSDILISLVEFDHFRGTLPWIMPPDHICDVQQRVTLHTTMRFLQYFHCTLLDMRADSTEMNVL